MPYWGNFKISDSEYRFWILKINVFLAAIGYLIKLLSNHWVTLSPQKPYKYKQLWGMKRNPNCLKKKSVYDTSILISVHSNCTDSIYADLGGLAVWCLRRWPGFNSQPGLVVDYQTAVMGKHCFTVLLFTCHHCTKSKLSIFSTFVPSRHRTLNWTSYVRSVYVLCLGGILLHFNNANFFYREQWTIKGIEGTVNESRYN